MSDKFEKNNNFDEEIFLALFRKGADEYLEKDLLKDIPSDEQREKIKLSETLEAKLKKQINSAIKKEKRKRRMKRMPIVAAVFIVLLVVLAVTGKNNVEAFRTKFMDMFVETTNTGTGIVFFNNNTDNEDFDVGDMDMPTYIPKGYKLSSSEVHDGIIYIRYRNANEDLIVITRVEPHVASSLGIDTEDADYGYIEINSYKTFYCTKRGASQLVFTTENYGYHIIGDNIVLDELIMFAESIKEK